MSLDHCIIPDHSINQAQTKEQKRKGKNKCENMNMNWSMLYIKFLPHTTPHLHSRQLAPLCQQETSLDDQKCSVNPTCEINKRKHHKNQEERAEKCQAICILVVQTKSLVDSGQAIQ